LFVLPVVVLWFRSCFLRTKPSYGWSLALITPGLLIIDLHGVAGQLSVPLVIWLQTNIPLLLIGVIPGVLPLHRRG
jgi:hypothetical protein